MEGNDCRGGNWTADVTVVCTWTDTWDKAGFLSTRVN